jgi:mannose-6-phosphate isomerase-like protein (cupin superfamily)
MTKEPLVLRRPHAERMPDGTEYAQLVPHRELANAPFETGIVKVPPGTTTWRHNHRETEVFIVVAGDATLEWDDGRRHVTAGDVIVVPPFMHHAFVNGSAAAEMTLLTLSWTQPGYAHDADRRAERLSEIPGVRYLVMTAGRRAAAPHAVAGVAARALRQNGREVSIVGDLPAGEADRSAHVRDVIARLQDRGVAERAHPSAGNEQLVIHLERHRHLLVRAVDRMTMTGNVKRFVADALAEPLPTLAVSGATGSARWAHQPARLLRALAEPSPDRTSRVELLSFFSIDDAFECAIAVPVLIQALDTDLPLPSVLHATDAADEVEQADGPVGATRRAAWSSWSRALAARVREHADGKAPEAGRWSARHVAAFADLDALAKRAGRAVAAESFSIGALVDVLDELVACALRLAASDPQIRGTETFEAESRTSLALELAALRQFGVLAAPLMPGAGVALGEALQLGPLGETPWSRARELLGAGARIDCDRLDGFLEPALVKTGLQR